MWIHLSKQVCRKCWKLSNTLATVGQYTNSVVKSTDFSIFHSYHESSSCFHLRWNLASSSTCLAEQFTWRITATDARFFLLGVGHKNPPTNTLLSGIQCSEILSFNPISTFISFRNQYFRLQVILTLYLTVDGLSGSLFWVSVWICVFFQSGDASLRNYSICAWNHSRICVTFTFLGISSRFRSQFFPHLWAVKEQKLSKYKQFHHNTT